MGPRYCTIEANVIEKAVNSDDEEYAWLLRGNQAIADHPETLIVCI